MASKLKEILAYPEFYGFGDADKIAIIEDVAPDFKLLNSAAQLEFLKSLKPPASAKAEPDYGDDWFTQYMRTPPREIDQALTEHASTIGAMTPGPAAPLVSGLGELYNMFRTGRQPTLPEGATVEVPPTGMAEANMPVPNELLRAMGVASLGQGAAKVAEKTVVPVLGKMLAPGAKAAERALQQEGMATAAKEMAEAGLPISPDVYAPSALNKALVWITDKFPLTRPINDTYRKQIADALLKMREEMVQGTLGLPDPSKMFTTLKGETTAAFGGIAKSAGGTSTKIQVPNVRQAVQDALNTDIHMTDKYWSENPLIQKIAQAPKSRSYEELLSSYGDPSHPVAQAMARSQYDREKGVGLELSIAEINDLYAKAMKTGGKDVYQKLSPEQRALRQNVRTAIAEDLKAYDSVMDTAVLDAAETAWSVAKGRYELKTAKLVESLFSGANGAVKPDPTTGAVRFFPTVLDMNMTKNKEALVKGLGEDKYQLLDAFRKKSMAAIPDLSKLQKSPGEYALLTTSGISTMGSIYAQPWLAVPASFAPLVSMSLMKPSGWLRKWLTTGMKPPKMTTTQGAKVATLEAFNSEEE